ncbi:MAG: hypothetical protein HY898_02590 [Deltaproteobacteria bacterium]|nr:hypothetical protein [Deltaproteobacteria bacterium]
MSPVREPATRDEPPAPVLVVASLPPVQTGTNVAEPAAPAPEPPPADLLAGVVVPKFPADDLNSVMAVGCGGGCPPAYVLETESRDHGQLRARIRFCEKLARKYVPDAQGSVSVQAQIDVNGRARRVVVEKDGDVPGVMIACVQRLVETAAFSFKYKYEREAQITEEIKPAEPVEAPAEP